MSLETCTAGLAVATLAWCACVPAGAAEWTPLVDLVRYPASFGARSVRVEGVVVSRFGRHVLLLQDDTLWAAATLAVVNPRVRERVPVGERVTVVGVLKTSDAVPSDVADSAGVETDLARAGVARALVASSIKAEDGREHVAAPAILALGDLPWTGARGLVGRRIDLGNVRVRHRMGSRALLVADESGAEAVVRLARKGLHLVDVREGEPVSVTGVVRKAPESFANWHPAAIEAMKSRALYVEASDVHPLAGP